MDTRELDSRIPLHLASLKLSADDPVAAHEDTPPVQSVYCRLGGRRDRYSPSNSLGLLFATLLLLFTASAQQRTPEIGYVFPAGGQVGTSFTVTVGGQFLDGLTNVFVSGDGVSVSVERYIKPMNQGVFTRLRDQIRELETRKTAADRDKRRGVQASTNEWTTADENTLVELRERILRNPPNRNATPALAEVATLQVTLATNATPGSRELRLLAASGLSNPILFHVGHLPEYSAPPAHPPNPELDRYRQQFGKPAPATTNRITPLPTLPVTVNGQIMPGEVDRYRFSARRGQKLVAAVRARELIPYLADAVPGWFQATLSLRDAQDRELAFADDYQLQPDPVLFYQIPNDGEYVVQIQDAIYRGREDFVYRLTLGELPFATGSFPLGGTAGQAMQTSLYGWNLPAASSQFTFSTTGIVQLPLGRMAQSLSDLPFAVDALPEVVEAERGDAPEHAQPVELPVIINGRIERVGDVDFFRCAGRAGQDIVIEVMARRLNSPLDSVVKLSDRAGQQIAFNDDHDDRGSGLNTHHADSYARATLPADGEYLVRLADAQNKGGAEFAYRLRLSPPRPDFELRVAPSSLNIRAGAASEIAIHALRKDGFDEDITLSLVNSPPGFTLSGAWVPAGQDQIRITLTADSLLAYGTLALQIEGRTCIANETLTRRASPADDRMQAFFYRHLVPARELLVHVFNQGRPAPAVRLASTTPARIPAGGNAIVRLELPFARWANQFQLALDDPPEGLSLGNISGGRGYAEIVVRADPHKLKPGRKGNFILSASQVRPNSPTNRPAATGQGRPASTILPAVSFEIITPE